MYMQLKNDEHDSDLGIVVYFSLSCQTIKVENISIWFHINTETTTYIWTGQTTGDSNVYMSTQRQQQHTYGRDRQLVIVMSICQHRDNNNIHMDEIDNW